MPAKVLQVVKLGNPDWLLTDIAEEFFERAFKTGSLVQGDNVRAGLRLELPSNRTIVLLGFVDGEVEAILIGFIPCSLLLSNAATLYHLYSNGGVKLRDKVIAEFVEWVKENGYDTILTYNFGKAKDKVGERA